MFFFFFFFFLVQVFPCEDTEQEELLNSDLLSSGSVCISVLCCRVLGLTYFHDVSALKEERNGMEWWLHKEVAFIFRPISSVTAAAAVAPQQP